MSRTALVLSLLLATGLVGCDALGIESGTAAAARKEADGKAIGSACRHALRAIEDCYTLNAKASKAAVYAGWREMDEYMRENKIEGIVPVIPRKSAKPAAAASAPEGEEAPAPAHSDAGDAADAPPARHAQSAGARQPTTH